jgi:hypothetical protein
MHMRVWMEVMKASPVVKALNWHQYSSNTQEPLTRERNEKGMSMAPTRMSAAAKLTSSRFKTGLKKVKAAYFQLSFISIFYKDIK